VRGARYAIAIILAITGVVYLATLRAGHDWGDDFAQYILHARNLCEGRPYAETGYLFNPDLIIGPRAYPPVFPALLAPVYAALGVHLAAFKVVCLGFFLLSLGLVFALSRRVSSDATALLVVLVLAASPAHWRFKDEIGSDWPFVFFVHAVFLAARVMAERPGAGALLVVLTAALALGTRSAGGVLLPSLGLSILWVRGPSRRALVGAALGLAAVVVVYQAFIYVDSSYLQQGGGARWHKLVRNLSHYATAAVDLLDNGRSRPLASSLTALVAGLAAVGLTLRVRRGPSVIEIFCGAYAVLILLWPFAQGYRFLLPIVPACLMYAFEGVAWICGRWAPRAARWAPACLAGAALISQASWYTSGRPGSIAEGISRPESQDLFRFVAGQTPEESVVAFWKPRALALMTGRSAVAVRPTAGDGALWRELSAFHVTHLVIGIGDRWTLQRFVDRHRFAFEPLHRNGDFRTYRILAYPP
jgi:hypothetical protein